MGTCTSSMAAVAHKDNNSTTKQAISVSSSSESLSLSPKERHQSVTSRTCSIRSHCPESSGFYENLVKQQSLLHQGDFNDFYQVLGELGEGGVCQVFKVAKKKTTTTTSPQSSQKLYALKQIHLQHTQKMPLFLPLMKNELAILRGLDHKNIIKIYESFHTETTLSVVMELCTGGDLSARLPYTQGQAKTILQQVLGAVAFLHDNGIAHRDIKFENILFESDKPEAYIKLIDFGFSTQSSRKNGIFMERVGTMYSMSPEAINGMFSEKSDLWSIGVVAYSMLANGKRPFEGDTTKELVRAIVNGHYSMDEPIWETVSDTAKDFVSTLLQTKASQRPTARQAMEHAFVAHTNTRSSGCLVDRVGTQLAQYADMAAFRKLALNVIAKRSNCDEIFELRKVFEEFDGDESGTIDLEDFERALHRFNYPKDVLQHMFHQVDVNRTNQINYTEFLAATLEAQGQIEEHRLAEAFDQLANGGVISKDNLRQLLGRSASEDHIDELIAQVDRDQDGTISYEEFLQAFHDDRTMVVTRMYQKDEADGPEHTSATTAAA